MCREGNGKRLDGLPSWNPCFRLINVKGMEMGELVLESN